MKQITTRRSSRLDKYIVDTMYAYIEVEQRAGRKTSSFNALMNEMLRECIQKRTPEIRAYLVKRHLEGKILSFNALLNEMLRMCIEKWIISGKMALNTCKEIREAMRDVRVKN